MVHKTHVQRERVSPSMVKSVFGRLKSNGYTDGQIIALSHDLSEMANRCSGHGNTVEFQRLTFEYDLSLLGF